MPLKTHVGPILTQPVTYVVMGAIILAVDLATGPFLQFPILFVIPVSMAAWYCGGRTAYGLASALPLGRLVIAMDIDKPSPIDFIVANAAIRVLVLLVIAFWVARGARQARELKSQYAELVTMCAWSRTIELDGEWISFEQYLKKRFNVDVSHGISPNEAEKAMQLFRERSTSNKDERNASDV